MYVTIMCFYSQDFAVTEAVQGDSDVVCERIGLLEDMRMEWEQVQTLRAFVTEAPSSLFGTDEVCMNVCC